MFVADAQLASGDPDAARATLNADQEAALGQFGPRNLFTVRTEMGLAHVTLVQGDPGKAQSLLIAVIASARELGPRAQPVLAESLQYLGECQMKSGQPMAAIAPLREGIGVLSQFAARGWQLAQMRERLGEALQAAGQPAPAAEILRQALPVLSLELGDRHPETLRARNALAKATK
jgi:tetratricopeptide (TPR) repeat protein